MLSLLVLPPGVSLDLDLDPGVVGVLGDGIKQNELSKHFNASLEHPVLCRLGWGHVARQRPGGDLRSQPSSLSGVQHVALLETAVVGH